jgi:hypothetical protein
MMLDKILRQNKMVEDGVKGLRHENGVGSTYTNADIPHNEEDMGVNIGNESRTENIHYHTQNGGFTAGNMLALPLSILLAGVISGAGLYFGLKDNPQEQAKPQTPDSTAGLIVDFGEPKDFNY